MSNPEMKRASLPVQDITISNTAAGSTAITKHDVAGGSVGLIASTTLATLTLWGSHDGTNYGPIYDKYGNAVTITVTSGSDPSFYELPDIVYKFPYIKLVDAANEETATVFLIG